jgi:hypothetical protein
VFTSQYTYIQHNFVLPQLIPFLQSTVESNTVTHEALHLSPQPVYITHKRQMAPKFNVMSALVLLLGDCVANGNILF